MPVKNEAWILPLSLACNSLWADLIIIADQNSNDGSQEIYKSFPKVRVIQNSDLNFNEDKRRQLLLDEARKEGVNNLLFFLDADEILSSDILNNFSEIEKNIKTGECVSLSWLQILGDFKTYDNSAIYKNEKKCFAFIDDGKHNFKDGLIHLSRVPEDLLINQKKLELPKVLHFQFVNQSRLLAKQRYYRIIEKMKGKKSDLRINFIYSITKNKPKKTQLPESFLKDYINSGIKFIFNTNESNYFEKEVLKNIADKGAIYFKYLDIWDVNWQEIANKYTEFNNSVKQFKDPRCLIIKLYHYLINTKLLNNYLRRLILIIK